MVIWTFSCYDEGKGDWWTPWYRALDGATKARHDVVFEFLEAREVAEWREPFCKILDKENRLFEICIHTKVQHRLIGFFGPAKHFYIVLHCTHKGVVYTPKKCKQTAKRRKDELGQESNLQKRKVVDCVRPQ